MQQSNFLKKWILSIVFISLIYSCWAQVYQSSIIENNSWAYNAAAIGGIKKYSGKALLSYRSQWEADAPYRDVFAAYQYRFQGLSIGGKIIREDAGSTSIARTRITGDIAYQKKLSHAGDLIGVGLSGGLMQRRITSGALKFDAQYSEGDGFDPTVDSGEMSLGGDRMVPVFDVGFIFQKFFFSSDLIIGLSAQNLNNYLGSGLADQTLHPTLYTIYSKYQIELYEDFNVEALLSYQKYADVDVPMVLISGRYNINDDYECTFGLGKRLQNTIMGQVGMKWQSVAINLGFDIAGTRLPISSSVIELSGTYSFQSK